MNVEGPRHETVDLSGYEFDVKDSSGLPLKVVLFSDSTNQSIDLEEDRIGGTTLYHMVLDVGGEDMEKRIRQNKINKIKVLFGGKTEVFPETLILPRAARIQTTTVSLGEMEHTSPHTRSDGVFDTGDDDPMNVIVIAETEWHFS